MLIGLALIGLAGHVLAQTQSHLLDGGNGVWQRLDTGGVNRAHGVHNGEKAVEEKRAEEDVQKLTDKFVKEVDTVCKAKEDELMAL